MSKSSLSSVVSNLVRAQMGSVLSPNVTDEDLDRHVAELILKEAKQKAEKYGKNGIRAYLQSSYNESNAPKTNKRFLSSIIKNTDDHNKTILRSQALAAHDIRMEREEQERRERRVRAEEAVAAERMRRLMGQGGRTEWASNWDRGQTRKRRERSWERWNGDGDSDDYEHERERERKRERRSGKHERERRHRHRSASRCEERRSRRDEESRLELHDPARRRRRRRDSEQGRSRSSDKHPPARDNGKRRSGGDTSYRRDRRSISSDRIRSRSPDTRRRPRHRSHSSSSSQSDDQYGPTENVDTVSREERLRNVLKRKGKAEVTKDADADVDVSPSRRSSRARNRSTNRHDQLSPRSRSLDFEPVKHGSSSSRTLRSSASPARSTSGPRSPSTSPPPLPSPPSKMDKYFESSYDPRLDVAPLAMPTVPKTGLIDDAEFAGWDAMLEVIRQQREYKEEKRMLERWGSGKDKDKGKKASDGLGAGSAAWSEGGSSAMGIQYKKRGSVREWDLGKEVF